MYESLVTHLCRPSYSLSVRSGQMPRNASQLGNPYRWPFLFVSSTAGCQLRDQDQGTVFEPLARYKIKWIVQDNVFITVVAYVQYRVLSEKASDAFYKLGNIRGTRWFLIYESHASFLPIPPKVYCFEFSPLFALGLIIFPIPPTAYFFTLLLLLIQLCPSSAKTYRFVIFLIVTVGFASCFLMVCRR